METPNPAHQNWAKNPNPNVSIDSYKLDHIPSVPGQKKKAFMPSQQKENSIDQNLQEVDLANMPGLKTTAAFIKHQPSQNIENKFVHKVVDGDSLLSVSLSYGVTQNSIKKANGLNTDEIYFLKEIIIPNPSKFLPNS
jgi:LysM repeat protein